MRTGTMSALFSAATAGLGTVPAQGRCSVQLFKEYLRPRELKLLVGSCTASEMAQQDLNPIGLAPNSQSQAFIPRTNFFKASILCQTHCQRWRYRVNKTSLPSRSRMRVRHIHD